MIERKKELKRRRKRRLERVKQRMKIIYRSQEEHKKFKREHSQETIVNEPIEKVNIEIIYPLQSAIGAIKWEKITDINNLINNLPSNIKTKEIWPYMPDSMDELKMQIIQMVKELKVTEKYCGPREWHGGFKEALVLVKKNLLPKGFAIALGI
jgi:uncharacterized protein with HEPN domain